MSTKRIPLFGSYITRNLPSSSGTSIAEEQFFKNCYPEIIKNPLSGDSTARLYKRLGCNASADTATGDVAQLGACLWTGRAAGSIPVFSFLDSTGLALSIYSYDLTSVAQLGSDIPEVGCRSITETTISGVANLVALVDLPLLVYFFPEGGAWTQITNTNFPPKQTPALVLTGDPVHMDGYMFVMCTNGQVWNSDVNSLANWTAGSFITAQDSPDLGVGLAKSGTHIVAFGSASVEFFRNINAEPFSPLQRVPGLRKSIGCKTPLQTVVKSIQQIGDNIIFIGTDATDDLMGVYLISGTTIKKISTSGVDKAIHGVEATIGIAGVLPMHGMHHVMFSNGVGSFKSLMYCLESDYWWEFASNQLFPTAAKSAAALGRLNVGLMTTGASSNAPAKIFKFGQSTNYQDNGATYTMTVQTMPYDHGTNRRKMVSKVHLVADSTPVHAVTLTGSSGSYISTPDAAALDIIADLRIEALIAPTDWTPATTNRTIVGKWTTTGNQISYALFLNTTGLLRFAWSTDGTATTAVNSTAAVATTLGLADTDWVWCAATLDVDNGATQNVVTFYTSIDGSTWNQLGDAVTTAGVTSIFSGSAIGAVGAVDVGTANLFEGKIYRARIYSDTAGTTKVADFNASFLNTDQTTYTDTTGVGRVWTMNSGTVAVSDVGISGGQVGLVATLEKSDDDLASFSELGDFDLTRQDPFIPGCGSHEGGRSYRITHDIPRPFRFEAIDVDFTVKPL